MVKGVAEDTKPVDNTETDIKDKLVLDIQDVGYTIEGITKPKIAA